MLHESALKVDFRSKCETNLKPRDLTCLGNRASTEGNKNKKRSEKANLPDNVGGNTKDAKLVFSFRLFNMFRARLLYIMLFFVH